MVVGFAKWRLGEDALIQCVSFSPGGEECGTEFMSGAEATEELEHAAEQFGTEHGPCGWIADERGVYGRVEADGSRTEFWDCDEQSWSEYQAENE